MPVPLRAELQAANPGLVGKVEQQLGDAGGSIMIITLDDRPL